MSATSWSPQYFPQPAMGRRAIEHPGSGPLCLIWRVPTRAPSRSLRVGRTYDLPCDEPSRPFPHPACGAISQNKKHAFWFYPWLQSPRIREKEQKVPFCVRSSSPTNVTGGRNRGVFGCSASQRGHVTRAHTLFQLTAIFENNLSASAFGKYVL